MTVFSGVRTPDSPADHGEVDHLAELVGEGKKFTDAKALAKGKAESDNHIKNLEKELAGLRDELKEKVTLEAVLAKIDAREQDGSNEDTPPREPEGTPKGQEQHSLSDIEALVEKKINQRQQANTQQQNLQHVATELAKALGSDFEAKFIQKGSELGISPEDLKTLAMTAPRAALELMGVKVTKQVNTHVPPTSSHRSSQNTPTGETWESYEKLRKTDPVQYWSPNVQQKLHKLALEGKLPNITG